MASAMIGHKTVIISDEAASLLSLLGELEKAGLIEDGRTNILVEAGYDAGSLEGSAASTITRHGKLFLQQQNTPREPHDQ